jgi:hypothetical protein
MSGPIDPFPTAKLTVPYLKELLDHVRDPEKERAIVIFHAESPEEGEWVMQNAASRLTRNKNKMLVCGPEPNRVTEILEHALRMKAQVAFAGEIRKVEDAQALRSGAALGLRVVAFLAVKDRKLFNDTVAELGPWSNVSLLSLSRH